MTLVCNLPFTRNTSFLGREEVLGRLVEEASRSQTILVQALTGLCGMGKTQTAVEYLLRYKRRYEFLFWFDACTRETLSTQIGRVFFLNETASSAVFAHFKWWLYKSEKWLVVLDHLEDFTLIDDLIAPKPSGQVLVTTRVLATGRWARAIRLQPLTPDEGALLLLRRARLLGARASLDEATPATVSLARALAEEVEGVPLVLDQLGAALQKSGGDVSALLTSYQQQPAGWLRQRGKTQDRTHPLSFAETIMQIQERLTPKGLELLRLCACFPHRRTLPDALCVPKRLTLNPSLRALVAEQFDYHRTIGELRRFSLLTQEMVGCPQSLPVVVQHVVQETLTPQQRQEYRRIGEAMAAEEQKRGKRG